MKIHSKYRARKKITFRLGGHCPNCQKSKLEYCRCRGSCMHSKKNLFCKTCNWSNF